MFKILSSIVGTDRSKVKNPAKHVLEDFLCGQDSYDAFVFLNTLEECVQKYPGVSREQIQLDKSAMENVFACFVISKSKE